MKRRISFENSNSFDELERRAFDCFEFDSRFLFDILNRDLNVVRISILKQFVFQ